MKKLILSAALLAVMTFAACSDDDSKKTNANCIPCDFQGVDEVCEGENGNAFLGGMDTEINYDAFVTEYCGGNPNPNPNPTENCVTCDAYEMQGITMPEMEVCEDEDGNAIVDGQASGMPFDQAITAFEMMTDCN